MLIKIKLIYMLLVPPLVLGQLNFAGMQQPSGTNGNNEKNNNVDNSIDSNNFSTRSDANKILQERGNGLIANVLSEYTR